MLQPGSDTSFYFNGILVDTVMLDYQVQTTSTGGTIHKRKQAVSKLRIVAFGLMNGWEDNFDECSIQQWIQQCR